MGRTWRFERALVRSLMEPPDERDVSVSGVADAEIAFFAGRLGKAVPRVSDPVDRSVALASLMIEDAVSSRASDIHLQVWEEKGEAVQAVSFRVDGVLHQVRHVTGEVYGALVRRLKLMAGMNPSEATRPQDGRIKLRAGDGRELDLRVSVVPSALAEALCIRILDRAGVILELERLRLSPAVQSGWLDLLGRSHGLVLVAGSTGSGKTTTLYASLKHLISPEIKVMSVEDPVEYLIPGMTQVPVRASAGVTFPVAMRSVLRQDPDVILLGEIRDLESALLCTQAALTGHLVLSTLHTGTAPGAVIRLLDMGLDPFLVSDCLIGVLAQRLIRLLCPACKRRGTAEGSDDECLRRMAQEGGVEVPPTGLEICYPVGCDACRGTGFRGRAGVHELLAADRSLMAAVRRRASIDEIEGVAKGGGMKTLSADAARKVFSGLTSPGEALRISRAVGR